MEHPPQPDIEEVERLVSCLMQGVAQFGDVSGSNAMSAVATFTNRFMRTLLDLSLTPADRKVNTQRAVTALRSIAAMIEHDGLSNVTIH